MILKRWCAGSSQGVKLADPALAAKVTRRLEHGWSPQLMAQTFATEDPHDGQVSLAAVLQFEQSDGRDSLRRMSGVAPCCRGPSQGARAHAACSSHASNARPTAIMLWSLDGSAGSAALICCQLMTSVRAGSTTT